jgi:hypothetical protein
MGLASKLIYTQSWGILDAPTAQLPTRAVQGIQRAEHGKAKS